jgi:glycosyltransferase involved in cell wall biosynthesis
VVIRRVLHYVDSEVFGGCEEAALHLMGSLDRTRWEPVLLYHPGAGIERLVDGVARLGVAAHALSRVDRRSRVTGVLRLRQAIRSIPAAVFHAHLSWPLACKHGTLAARLARQPAVGTAQLFVEPASKMEAGLWLRLYHRIIAVSEDVRAHYAEDLRVPRRKLLVAHNGLRIPPVRSTPRALRDALVQGRPGYVALTSARLHPQKGHAFLLAAAALVPDVTFVLAGDGPLRTQLERQARELGIANRCVFLGERSDIPDLLAAADLLVLPSLYEGLPLAVLEGMAAARPVIATAIGGTSEAIETERSGLLVPPSDPQALASAIRRVRSDPALAHRLAAAGRERVVREFSATATARIVMDVYDQVARAVGR